MMHAGSTRGRTYPMSASLPAPDGPMTATRRPRIAGGPVLRPILRRSHSRHLMRLQSRQHVAAEAADLLEEQFLRQHAAIEADLNHVGAGLIGDLDDLVGHFLGRAP